MRIQIGLIVMAFALLSACASRPVEDFARVKNHMLKDEVLEVVGAPNRTERFDGKEKWTYRYFTGAEKNVEELYFVTFYEGKVISYGLDHDEMKRQEDIRKDFQSRKERKKTNRDAAASLREQAAKDEAEAALARKNAIKQDKLEENTPQPEPNFKEIPGRAGPITQEQ